MTAPNDFWRLLLGDDGVRDWTPVGGELYAAWENVVVCLSPSENGVKVGVHAGFYTEREFAFERYFTWTSTDRGYMPRIVTGNGSARWAPNAPKQEDLEALYTDLRNYIALWGPRRRP